MERGLREEVKTLIHSLLVPHAKGLPISKLCKEYAECERKHIPFTSLGYDNLLDFLRSIPDTVRITTLPIGLTIVKAVPKEQSSHIQELVRGQKNRKTGNTRLINNLLSNNRVGFASRPNHAQQYPGRPRYQYSQTSHERYAPSSSNSLHSFNNQNAPALNARKLTQPSNHMFANAFVTKEEQPALLSHQTSENVKANGEQVTQLHHQTHMEDTRMNDKQIAQPYHQSCMNSSLVNEEQLVQPQWDAVDIRMHSRDLQTMVLNPEVPQNGAHSLNGCSSTSMLRTENASQRKNTPISKLAGCPRKPSSYGGIGDTFGVVKPDLADACTQDTIIPHENFPKVPENDFFFVIVAEVYTPDRFYWFLNQNRKAIEQLTDDMGVFYNLHEEYVCSLKEMYVGQIVAARYEDNLWYRAQVLGYRNGEFQVFYIDYGSSGSVTTDKLRHMPLHFAKLPVQAFRGRLHGIKPISPDGKWSPESSKHFLNLIKGSKVIAAAKMSEECLMITDSEYETSYAMTLVDTNSEQDIIIADNLVDQGLAVAIQSDVLENPPACASVQTVDSSPAQLQSKQSSTTGELLNHSLVPGVQLAYELEKRLSLTNGRGNVVLEQKEETRIETCVRESDAFTSFSSTWQPSPDSEVSSTGRVKRIELSDGRVFFIIKVDGELYLTKFELLKLIPNLDTKIKSSKMKLNVTIKESSENPQLFYECLLEQAPWIKDASGKVITTLVLFPLGNVQTFLFLFGKDKTASLAFEAELKEKNNPNQEGARKTFGL